MGFGLGILTRRRQNLIPGSRVLPPVVLVARAPMMDYVEAFRSGGEFPSGLTFPSEQPRASLATVITPAGTPPFREDPSTGFPSARDPFGIVKLQRLANGQLSFETERTLISDARDLFVSTIFERTARRDGSGEIRLEPQARLRARNEELGMWTGEESALAHQYVHIGRTQHAMRILSELRPQFDAAIRWDGNPDKIDADGFIALSVLRGNSFHLLLLGGGPYGTFFAVAWFLEKYAGVRWLLPIKLGTVIPRVEVFVSPGVHWIDEPDYRSRTLSLAFNMNEVQTDEARHWQLCNRMRPFQERSTMFYKQPRVVEENGAVRCSDLPPQKRALLASEERIPVTHNLTSFFSPHLPSSDPQHPGTRPRVESVPDMYPDPRVRTFNHSYSFAGQATVGTRPYRIRCQPNVADAMCGSLCDTVCSVCPAEEPIFGTDATLLMAIPGATEQTGETGRFTDVLQRRPESIAHASRTVAGIFSTELATGVETLRHRYIPRTFAHHHYKPKLPFEGWSPCLYISQASYAPGVLPRFRETVAKDLAYQLWLSVLNVFARGATEFCESLSATDGALWCQCFSCRMNNGFDGSYRPPHVPDSPVQESGDVAVMYRGHIVILDYRALSQSDRTRAQALLRIAREVQPSTSQSAYPFTDDVDAAALRGIIPDRTRLNMSAAAWQGLDQVVEVSGYDQLDIEAVLLTTTGSPTNAKIVIYTSMQRKPEASTSSDIPWQVLTTFTLTTPPEYSCTTAPIAGGQPLLRFIRWKLYFTGGSSPTATFQISILARRKSI